jgi:predicted unusual protein kinase regulating ubiquinone biosynthesis (AarF/ABC1/UbiB family)
VTADGRRRQWAAFAAGVTSIVILAAIGAGIVKRLRRLATTRAGGGPAGLRHGSRRARNTELARLGARVGRTYASTAARKAFASAERAEALDRERELRTAQDVAASLGRMKGALMKIGQMASYLDDGLPEPLRLALGDLLANAPPMSPELAAGVIHDELGAAPDDVFLEWDPEPIAAASIGQVHRALWWDPDGGTERAVAVKVQYPGVADAIRADLANADLLGSLMSQLFKGLDPGPMVGEIQARIGEELDYRIEAENQQAFADFYRGHPFVHVPAVIAPLSTGRVLTTELATGAGWDELLTWSQAEKDLAAEAIFRFVFRSLYRFHAFNGDPHPGNYVFRPGGHVSFLDFGLVKHFDEQAMQTFQAMIGSAVLEPDHARFRNAVEDAGLLRRGAPVSTDEVGRYFAHFYEAVRTDQTITWTTAYASATVRRTFDRNSPIAQYATVPADFVIIQRINLGLYAILGHLGATANYRKIAEELWPMVSGPPSTRMGEAEAAWLAARSADVGAQSGSMA